MENQEQKNKALIGGSGLNAGLDLLPCPFCDESKPVLIDFERGVERGIIKTGYEVICCFCGTTTRMFSSESEAATFWNTRSNVKARGAHEER